jgi:hypothetical protein
VPEELLNFGASNLNPRHEVSNEEDDNPNEALERTT